MLAHLQREEKRNFICYHLDSKRFIRNCCEDQNYGPFVINPYSFVHRLSTFYILRPTGYLKPRIPPERTKFLFLQEA
jgi:hypothetical protein